MSTDIQTFVEAALPLVGRIAILLPGLILVKCIGVFTASFSFISQMICAFKSFNYGACPQLLLTLSHSIRTKTTLWKKLSSLVLGLRA